ncbi:MAG: WD40 repeat domain-containing protein [Oscillatoria sp. PMC 1051.18]|nr:WD40 repeat domain-containing protein [Oscillatoria sp. PMC 1050.18]MEC5031428.1 WD40 repeat domain-containing protein [Oscillatoria sp. PMC 1051.18]
MTPWLQLLLETILPIVKSIAYAKISDLSTEIFQEKQHQALSLLKSVASETQIDLTTQNLKEKIVKSPESSGKEIEELLQFFAWLIEQTGLNFPSKTFLQEKALQQQLVVENRETLLQFASYQRETTLKLPEIKKIIENWSLRLLPSQLLESHLNRNSIPLLIFVAPPAIKDDSNSEICELESQINEGLRNFLTTNYPLNSQIRPTEFLGGALDANLFRGEASIKALSGILKSEPTLILDSEISGDYLYFRLAYWGLAQESYTYQTLLQIPYRELLNTSAKKRARKWQETQTKLLELGKTIAEIKRLGGENYDNLTVLAEEEELQQAGIDPRDLNLSYQINGQDWEYLNRVLIACHCLVAGWMADIYYLMKNEISPQLPQLFPDLIKDIPDEKLIDDLATATVSIYQNVFEMLAISRFSLLPELTINLAYSLSYLPNQTWANQQLDISLASWLHLHQLPVVSQRVQNLQNMSSALTGSDEKYCQSLQKCLLIWGDNLAVTEVEKLLKIIASQTKPPQQIQFSLRQTIADNSAAVTSLAISPNQQTLTLVGGSDDCTIKLWDLETNFNPTPRKILNGHSGKVLAIALDRDGQILASSDKSQDRSYIKIWHFPTGKLCRTLFGHKKDIHSLALSPNGQTLVSGSHKIKLWDLKSGEPLCTLFGHKEWVYALTFSPDGETIISGSEDKTVKIWHPTTEELLSVFQGHQASVTSVTISLDGSKIASASKDCTLKVWDVETEKLLYSREHSGAVYAVKISPDGQYIFSASEDKTIKIWHLETGELVQTLADFSAAVRALALSPDGQTLASRSQDNLIKIWRCF